MGDLLFQEIQDALCREGKLLPDLGVATFQLLAETTLGPTAYHLTDGFTTGSVATLTAGIEEGELLRELGKEQGVSRLIDWDCLVVLLLLVETQAKHLHLHGEHVVGHSLGKTDAGICFRSGLFQELRGRMYSCLHSEKQCMRELLLNQPHTQQSDCRLSSRQAG